jgi:hypothetical protein
MSYLDLGIFSQTLRVKIVKGSPIPPISNAPETRSPQNDGPCGAASWRTFPECGHRDDSHGAFRSGIQFKKLEDFNGNYQKVEEIEGSVSGGGSRVTIKNQNGVVVNVVPTIKGRKFDLTREGLDVQLKI